MPRDSLRDACYVGFGGAGNDLQPGVDLVLDMVIDDLGESKYRPFGARTFNPPLASTSYNPHLASRTPPGIHFAGEWGPERLARDQVSQPGQQLTINLPSALFHYVVGMSKKTNQAILLQDGFGLGFPEVQ